MQDIISMSKHEYMLCLSDKDLKATLYDLGTMFDHISITDGIPMLHSIRLQQTKAISNGVFGFLMSAEFIDRINYQLTPTGKSLFELLYIHQDTANADVILKQSLLKNPVVNLVGQVFYGRGKQSVEQLRTLLNYHNIADKEVEYGEVISLLSLLNKFGIVVYDKKNKLFYVKEVNGGESPIQQYYINPNTPFSNIYNLRKVLRACHGSIFWIDKHFRKEGLEILLDGLPFEGITSVTIISGTDNLTQSAKSAYTTLKIELASRSIVLNWRIVTDNEFKWHDRWLLADNQCYNIPPVLAIIRGQRSDILQTKSMLDPTPFIDVSIPLESVNPK